MASRIGQIIYDNTENSTNTAEERQYNRIVNGKIDENAKEIFDLIKENYGDITALQKLGVRAAPGAQFALNGEIIMVGRSGKYEVFSDLIYITSINVLSEHRFFFDFKY